MSNSSLAELQSVAPNTLRNEVPVEALRHETPATGKANALDARHGDAIPMYGDTNARGFKTVEDITVADCVIAHLEAEEVDAVFGIPGGNLAPFQQALRKHASMRFIISSHEAGAAFMADGYARATGKLGVCMVTAGPGATNALTGVASASLDGVPMLAISGNVATDRVGLMAMQESSSVHGVNTVEMFRQACLSSTGINDPQSFQRLLARAMRTAQGLPGGAAHLSVPSNIARQPIHRASVPTTRGAFRARPANAPFEDLRAAFTLLRTARRPLIFLGSGAREAMAEHADLFTAFVTQHGIPVATSMRGKGLFSEREALSLGVLGLGGSKRSEAYLREGVDVMLVLGSRLGEWASKSFHRYFQSVHHVIQVDVNASNIGQFLPVRLPIVADAGSVVTGLAELGQMIGPSSGARVQERWAQVMALTEPTPVVRSPQAADSVKPQDLMLELDKHLSPDMDLYIDMGNCSGWTAHILHVTPPARIFYPCGLSSMGWSCGAVIGGKIGRPDRTAVAVVGDGAFLMNGTEMLTASRYKVGTVTIVLNDNFLGMVNHGEHVQDRTVPLEDDFYGLGNPDLKAFSESLGARAYTVNAPGQLDALLPEVLRRAKETGQPQVIVAHIDYREVPPYGDRFAAVASDGK
ncbi:thiamine pyrophosphate-binding protein [Corallococcus interemptor]|uniref:Thiamine pyrophosphate-binding protein n=1 Tax=Corallococcus interemptor TaxID=2316720 RepID=A0A3A8QKT0_9BACT|nr:thiamine pyrophosphate-binding protein [Corallococcus interemptor]RKH44371.1 thiamine pyrophosphate-binding protein [Corallococcus sp. AB050B]RKH67530.1 thiamine pyrophosphate-binding protein [Corallococcus interemptor]